MHIQFFHSKIFLIFIPKNYVKYQDFKSIMFTNFHFFSFIHVAWRGGVVDKILRENYFENFTKGRTLCENSSLILVDGSQ